MPVAAPRLLDDKSAPVTPDNIVEHLAVATRRQLEDDVPTQIKEALQYSRERRWARGVIRPLLHDSSRDLD